jgi:hypothetical protein
LADVTAHRNPSESRGSSAERKQLLIIFLNIVSLGFFCFLLAESSNDSRFEVRKKKKKENFKFSVFGRAAVASSCSTFFNFFFRLALTGYQFGMNKSNYSKRQ